MKVIHELIAYFERRGQITPKMMVKLTESGYLAADAPASVTHLCQQIGQTFYFRVIGDASGTVWGTDTYTGDSHFPSAAVHAGAVKIGESGVVRVKIVPALSAYQGTTRNGITSNSYGPWGTAYQIEAV
jgi:hypothetical protein